MNVFITGATGFLGSAVAKQLLARGYNVRALSRTSPRTDLLGDAASGIDWISGDVLDVDSLITGMHECQAVFHCAAYLGFQGKSDDRLLKRINVGGTANVVNAL